MPSSEDARTLPSDRVDHPHIGWWVAVLGGLGTLGVLAFDAGAYATWCAHVTAGLSQGWLRSILVAAVFTHAAEAAYAWRLARRAGLGTSTAGWVLQTFALGFPSLRLLRRRCDSVRWLVQLNGIAHVYLTVRNFERCLPFYEKLLGFFEMQCLVKTDSLFYCVGSRTGIGIRAAAPEHTHTAFDPSRSGLHHLCFRARSRDDVDAIYAFVQQLGARIVHPPQEDAWAPGYYSVLFEDPDGLRLEANYVPGKGNLDASITLPLAADVQARLSER